MQTDNCYAYAINQRGCIQPGNCLGNGENVSCETLIKNIVRDGHRPIDCDTPCKKTEHKIMAFVAPNHDYHFYKQTADGKWTHKSPYRAPTNLDSFGKIIENPVGAYKYYNDGDLHYTNYCGCFCVKN